MSGVIALLVIFAVAALAYGIQQTLEEPWHCPYCGKGLDEACEAECDANPDNEEVL